MQSEGGLAEGGIVIQDCLSLLANLIRHSTSNQSLFRESGCIPRLVDLVKQASISPTDENQYSRSAREKNAWGLFAVLRLFLEKGEVRTKSNQDIFWRSSITQLVLDQAFAFKTPPPIRASALRTCADMIISNGPLQEQFAALQVLEASEPRPPTNGTKRGQQMPRTYVIEALLGLVLSSSATELQDTRYAACNLIKAYFHGHGRVKHHFLQRAIAGFVDGEDDRSNVLSTLMAGPQAPGSSDVLRFTLASDILSQLVMDDSEAKGMLMAVTEGNADKGEDVISATQTLAGHLASCLSTDLDPRTSIAYLNLLITFLFDDQDTINDCLAEGSSLLGALISSAAQSTNSQIAAEPVKSLLPGLCAVLLGVIYEFSSKDSPISRRTLQPFLATRLGRQRYFDALRQLRQHHIIRDQEMMSEVGVGSDIEAMLFDASFIEWFKDEYGRLKRAIDKDPGIEVIGRKDTGVDRDILDDLRSQLASKDQSLQQLENDSLSARQQADQTNADHRKELQSLQSSQRSMEAEVERVRRINEALQRDHETEIQRLQNDMNNELERVHNAHKTSFDSSKQQHQREMERIKGQHGASLASERSLWEDKARKASEQLARDHGTKLEETAEALQARNGEIVVLKQDLQSANGKLERIQQELQVLQQAKEQADRDLQKTTSLQEGLQQVNSKALSRIKTLEDEIKQSGARLSSMTDKRDRLTTESSEHKRKTAELQDELEGLKEELAAERKGYGELEAELEKVKKSASNGGNGKSKAAQIEKDLVAAKKEAEKEKDDAKKARTELEDMLMVMSDIETKRDAYKERLQKLGEQVTDEEDEGDEDGDEDEDEVE